MRRSAPYIESKIWRGKSQEVKIEYIHESSLGAFQKQAILQLLNASFGDGLSEVFGLRPLPDARILIRSEGHLIGHLAVEFRRVRVGSQIVSVCGASEICVHPDAQRKGIGRVLIRQLEDIAKEKAFQFILAFSDNPAFYKACEFESRRIRCRWLMIQQGVSMGVLSRTLSGVMVKAIENADWPEGELDLLGHIF